MARLSDTALAEIEASLPAGIPPGLRRVLIRDFAQRFGVTENSIYGRFPAGRGSRADAKSEHIELAPETLSLAMAMKVQTDGTLGWKRIAQLSDAGVSVSTLKRRAAKLGLTLKRIRKGTRTYRLWQAPHSNAVHQIDDTVSVLYYVHEDGTLRRYDIRPYKNKPQTDLPQLHLFVCVDDFSRRKYAKYYIRKRDAVPMQFLFDCWSVLGLPDTMLVDQDQIWKTQRVKTALDESRLNVKIDRTMPKTPWAKGKVEKSIGDFERSFEQMIQWMDHVENVDQLNHELERYVHVLNWEDHSSTCEVPMKRWRRCLPTDRPVRLLPPEEIQRWLMMEQVTRKVDAHLQIRLRDARRGVTMFYGLGQIRAAHDWKGEEVTVSYFPGDYSVIIVSRGEVEAEVRGQEGRIVNEKGEFQGGWKSNEAALIEELATKKIVIRPNWEKYLPAEAMIPRIAPAGQQVESVMFDRLVTVVGRYDGKKKANELMVQSAGRELSYEEYGGYNERFAATETVVVDDIRAWVEELMRRAADDKAQAIAG